MLKHVQEALRGDKLCGTSIMVWGSKHMDWIITPFQRALDFKGRSRRKEYWLFVLFSFIVAVAVCAVFAAMGGFVIPNWRNTRPVFYHCIYVDFHTSFDLG
jgi:Protein of unknown function (DUF805)